MADGAQGAAPSPAAGTSPSKASLSSDSPQPKKTVLFIRHAESAWNRAIRRRDALALGAALDAPLTPDGYAQARALQCALRAAVQGGDASGTSAVLRSLAAVDAIWASPLARALQTALVGLLPVYEGEECRVALQLKPVARERKTFGWDTIGGARGERCRSRACAKLARLAPAAPTCEELAAMRAVACDAREASRSWWTRTWESRARTRRRAHQLVAALLSTGDCAVVVVSHSNFMREVFSTFLVDAAADEPAGLAQLLRTSKVPNCSVISCDLIGKDGSGATLCNARCWLPPGAQLRALRHGPQKAKGNRSSAKVAPE
jgi:broad specificity phosphatase PhoE